MLSFLLMGTIATAFIFGIALGYWAVCGVLYLFQPARPLRKVEPARILAPTASGD